MEKKEIVLNSNNIDSLSILLYSADLHIQQYNGNKITIETDAILDRDFEIIEKNKKLEIFEKKRSFINYSFFNNSKEFEILVPESISLFISIASGVLGIENIRLKKNNEITTKTIDIKLTSGDFSAENLSASVFIFSSTSSNMTIRNSKLVKTKIKGISSDIYIKDCFVDEIELKSISGDIDLEFLSFNKIIADLKSGDINIICPKTKINGQFNSLSGDVDIDGIEIDKSINTPFISLNTLSGDISIKGKFAQNENIFPSSFQQPIKSVFEESSKKDEKEKFIQLLLEGKILEKDAVELLKGFGFSDSEIDAIFEEYLFRKINRGEKDE